MVSRQADHKTNQSCDTVTLYSTLYSRFLSVHSAVIKSIWLYCLSCLSCLSCIHYPATEINLYCPAVIQSWIVTIGIKCGSAHAYCSSGVGYRFSHCIVSRIGLSVWVVGYKNAVAGEERTNGYVWITTIGRFAIWYLSGRSMIEGRSSIYHSCRTGLTLTKDLNCNSGCRFFFERSVRVLYSFLDKGTVSWERDGIKI